MIEISQKGLIVTDEAQVDALQREFAEKTYFASLATHRNFADLRRERTGPLRLDRQDEYRQECQTSSQCNFVHGCQSLRQ